MKVILETRRTYYIRYTNAYVFNLHLSCLVDIVVHTRAHFLFTLFVFVCVRCCPTHIVLCFCLVFPRL